MCIICEKYSGTFVVFDLDQQNESDATTFPPPSTSEFPSHAGEIIDHPNDLDESRTAIPMDSAISIISASSPPQSFGNPDGSSTLPSSSEVLLVAEASIKSKRKRRAQSPPGELRRSTRLKAKKVGS